MEKEILLAQPRGFCAGVDRAIEIVERALAQFGAPVYVRHEIVHNAYVVEDLRAKGAIFIEDLADAPPGSHLVFSAHGVSPAVVKASEARGLNTIDATCPLVTKVHREVQRFAAEEYDILLIGHEGHEEVEGTAGEAPDHVQLVDGKDGIDNAKVKDPKKVIWLSQTTLSVDETMETVLKLREKFPTLQNPPSDDICYATQNRQVAIKKVGSESDLVLVIGSANSSNTVRLVEVALEAGAKAAYRIDYASEIKEEWFEGVETVGVSSGASAPEELVDEVLEYLEKRQFGKPIEITTAEEDVQFSLPKELRKDLKQAGEDTSNKAKRS